MKIPETIIQVANLNNVQASNAFDALGNRYDVQHDSYREDVTHLTKSEALSFAGHLLLQAKCSRLDLARWMDERFAYDMANANDVRNAHAIAIEDYNREPVDVFDMPERICEVCRIVFIPCFPTNQICSDACLQSLNVQTTNVQTMKDNRNVKEETKSPIASARQQERPGKKLRR